MVVFLVTFKLIIIHALVEVSILKVPDDAGNSLYSTFQRTVLSLGSL